MKMMHGAFFFASANKERMRLAPTPTNISTNSEPEQEMKGTPASPATARASRVLPVPGGPSSITPLGVRQEVHDLLELEFRRVAAGDVVERDARLGLHLDLGLRLEHAHGASRAAHAAHAAHAAA